MEPGDSSAAARGLGTVGGYEAAHEVVRRSNQRLVKRLPPDTMREVTEHCGLDVLDLPDAACDEMLVALVDAALYAWPPDGPSVLDTFLAGPEAAALEPHERAILDPLARGRLRLFHVARKTGTPEVEIVDAATLDRLGVWDEGLASDDIVCDQWLLARLFEIDGEWLTSGAILPVCWLHGQDDDGEPVTDMHSAMARVERALANDDWPEDDLFAYAADLARADGPTREIELDLLREALDLHTDFHDDEDHWPEEDGLDDDFVEGDDDTPPPLRVLPKIGRNEPCPCGSGKKYKNCCMK